MAPAIHIGPGEPEHLIRAVEEGGGRPVALEEAEGVVWAGPETTSPSCRARCAGCSCSRPASSRGSSASATRPDVQFTSAVGAYATQVAELALGAADRGRARPHRYARAWTWDPQRRGHARGLDGGDHRRRRDRARADPACSSRTTSKIIAVTRSGRDGTLPVERIGEIWGQADHFVLCAPATDGTRHLIGAPELWAMKPHSWIVNIARGSLIDTDALVAGARERGSSAARRSTSPTPSRCRTATRCGPRRTR